MSFKIGPKVLVVNDPTQAVILFVAKKVTGNQNVVETGDDFGALYDNLTASPDTQTAEASGYSPIGTSTSEEIAQADLLRILGYGDFTGAEITKASGSKGILPVKQISTLTFVANSPDVGDEVIVNFVITGLDTLRGELASYASDYKVKRTIVLKVAANETATTLATRLVAQFAADQELPGYVPFTATNLAGVVTFTSKDAEVEISVSVSGSAVSDGDVTGTFAVTTAGFAGRNTWRQLSGLRLETSKAPYMEKSIEDQFPIVGAKYSRYVITKSITREDGFSSALNSKPTGEFKFEIYLNESTCAALILDLTKWLNANVAVREMYTATTASAAIAAESPTTATSVDSSNPFTTPIV